MSADLPPDIGPAEPGLDVLLGLLASDATPGELAGERDALAMFRASRPQPAVAPGSPAEAPAAARRPGHRARWAAAAVTFAVAAGFAVAAYTETLPTPLQNAAYHVLGFAGIPRADHARPPAPGSAPAGPARAHRAPQASGGPHRPAATAAPRPSTSPSPPASGPVTVTVTIANGRIVAGTDEVVTGDVSDQGQPVPGATVKLLERTAAQPVWHAEATATTGADGRAVTTAADLTANTEFRLEGLAGPANRGAAVSRTVLVVVVPPVAARLSPVPHGRADVVTVSSPLAVPGDIVVLQVQSSPGRWVGVQMRQLSSTGQAEFLVRAQGAGGAQRSYRAVLVPTAAHSLSVSNTVTAP